NSTFCRGSMSIFATHDSSKKYYLPPECATVFDPSQIRVLKCQHSTAERVAHQAARAFCRAVSALRRKIRDAVSARDATIDSTVRTDTRTKGTMMAACAKTIPGRLSRRPSFA